MSTPILTLTPAQIEAMKTAINMLTSSLSSMSAAIKNCAEMQAAGKFSNDQEIELQRAHDFVVDLCSPLVQAITDLEGSLKGIT